MHRLGPTSARVGTASAPRSSRANVPSRVVAIWGSWCGARYVGSPWRGGASCGSQWASRRRRATAMTAPPVAQLQDALGEPRLRVLLVEGRRGELLRRAVARRDEHPPRGEEPIEDARDDRRVGNVHHLHLIETEDTRGDRLARRRVIDHRRLAERRIIGRRRPWGHLIAHKDAMRDRVQRRAQCLAIVRVRIALADQTAHHRRDCVPRLLLRLLLLPLLERAIARCGCSLVVCRAASVRRATASSLGGGTLAFDAQLLGDRLRVGVETLVALGNEGVEVHSPHRHRRAQRVVIRKEIHQQRLPAADIAVNEDAPWRRWWQRWRWRHPGGEPHARCGRLVVRWRCARRRCRRSLARAIRWSSPAAQGGGADPRSPEGVLTLLVREAVFAHAAGSAAIACTARAARSPNSFKVNATPISVHKPLRHAGISSNLRRSSASRAAAASASAFCNAASCRSQALTAAACFAVASACCTRCPLRASRVWLTLR